MNINLGFMETNKPKDISSPLDHSQLNNLAECFKENSKTRLKLEQKQHQDSTRYMSKGIDQKKISKPVLDAVHLVRKIEAAKNGFTDYQYDKHMKEMYGDDYDQYN